MAIIKKSSYVSAPSGSTVKKYVVPDNPQLTEDALVFDPKVPKYYEAILKNYDNINTRFKNIAKLYNGSVKNLKGTDLKKKIKTLATNCSLQGDYCLKRKGELKRAYKYAEQEKEWDDFMTKWGPYLEQMAAQDAKK